MESLSDIVAEMRTRSRELKQAWGEKPDGVENMLDIWADRIEAAWKREVVSKKETTTIGNAAALREALVKAKKAICHHAEHICQSLSWENSDMQSNCADVLCAHRELCKAKTAINAALSAPARNCDKFVTQPEMSRAYEEYRKSAMKNYGNGLTGRVPTAKQKPMTYDEWLLAPAAEEGAGK